MSTVHVVRHVVPLQAKLPHELVVPRLHAPMPLQVAVDVMPLPGEVQEAAPHDMPAPTLAHPALPQDPVLV